MLFSINLIIHVCSFTVTAVYSWWLCWQQVYSLLRKDISWSVACSFMDLINVINVYPYQVNHICCQSLSGNKYFLSNSANIYDGNQRDHQDTNF